MLKFLTIVTVALSINICQAQKSIPLKALSDFKNKFPLANKIKWDREINGNFDVVFLVEDKKMTAKYSDKGEWLEIEKSIEVSKIPPAVGASFKREHTKAKIKSVYKIETPKQFKYKIEFKEDSKAQEIIYDIDGAIVK